MNFKDKKVLIIAPHPDDEILGCGGLIGRVKQEGGKVYILIVTVGNTELYGGKSNVDARMKETEDVMKFIKADGYDVCLVGDDYHLKLDTVPQKKLVDLIEKESKFSLNKIKPDVVVIPFIGSVNQDHRAVSQAALTACRPRPHELKAFQSVVLLYEDPAQNNSLEFFKPTFYVDIKDTLDFKCNALALYKSQVRGRLHQCSEDTIRIKAQSRGREIAIEAAEAFMLHRFLA